MKTLTTTLLGLLVFASVSQADVFIYKNRITGSQTGGGVSAKVIFTGYTIVDTDAPDAPVMLLAIATKTSKTFSQYTLADCIFDPVTGPMPKKKPGLLNYFVVTQASLWSTDDGYEYADTGTLKGSCVNIPAASIGTTNAWLMPKTISWIGRSTYPNDNGESVLEETSGTLTLDLTWTKTCNSFDDAGDAAVNRMRSYLASIGYTETGNLATVNDVTTAIGVNGLAAGILSYADHLHL